MNEIKSCSVLIEINYSQQQKKRSEKRFLHKICMNGDGKCDSKSRFINFRAPLTFLKHEKCLQ